MSARKVDKTPTRSTEPKVEEDLVRDSSRGLNGKGDIAFMTMLRELVEEHGGQGTAELLEVSYRSISRAFEAGRPSRRLKDALQMHLLLGGGAAAAKQRELVQALQRRMDALESKVGGVDEGVEELVVALREELSQLRETLEEKSEAIGLLERRTNRRDSRRGAESAIGPEVAGIPAGPGYRVYRELVTWEPEDGEEDAYGDAASLVVEWRRVRKEALAGGDSRSARQSVERLRELEIALIREYGLTLPPAKHPWDRHQRRDELARRIRVVEESRRGGGRALFERWLRRVLAGR